MGISLFRANQIKIPNLINTVFMISRDQVSHFYASQASRMF